MIITNFFNRTVFCLLATYCFALHAERVLFVIDAQTGFVNELPVANATDIVAPINDLIQSGVFKKIIATKDFHPANHKSFKTVEGSCINSPYKWETHCVENTDGARFIKGLNLSKENAIVSYKGQNPDLEEFSGWNAVIQNGEHQGKTVADAITNMIHKGAAVELAFTGLATEYCVHSTAIDAAKEIQNANNKNVSFFLIEDAVKGVADKTSTAAIDQLKSVGFRVVTAREYIKRAQAENN